MKKYILFAVVLAPLGFFTHGLLTSMTIPQKEMERREARQKAVEAQEKASYLEAAKRYSKKMALVASKNQNIPESEILCPAGLAGPIDYIATDPEFFEHFASGTYTKTIASPEPDTWYRSKHAQKLLDLLRMLPSPEKLETWDRATIDAVKTLEKTPYFLILYPEKFYWPKIEENTGIFFSGVFAGWQALVDASTGEILCRHRLFAVSSESVEYKKYKTRRLATVHDNAEKKIKEDFIKNFWAAVQANLEKRSVP